MADIFPKAKRSWIMARVRTKDTAPEMIVRKMVHRMGFRYRLHARDLPGKPDIVLPRHRKIIFVSGCLWHGHTCPRGKRPTSNASFWAEKIGKNVARDLTNIQALNELGWDVLVVWQCETRIEAQLMATLDDFLRENATNDCDKTYPQDNCN
jgi:DNA mismatch endonuclease (patch repair protein)